MTGQDSASIMFCKGGCDDMEIIDLNEAQVEDIETRLSSYDEQHIACQLNGRIQIGV